MRVTHLKTEYKTNPIGVGTASPRLNWQLQSISYHTIQIAFQVRCALSLHALNSHANLLWDSSRIESNCSVHIDYKGLPLKTGQIVFWQVKVWDNHGNEAPWSEPAWWEMGLMSPSDWIANWIESDISEDVSNSTPAPFLRKSFVITKPVVSARVYVSALGLYELSINGKKAGDDYFTPGWTTYQKRVQYQVYDVTEHIKEGDNAIGAILGDGWYRGFLVWQGKKNLYGEKIALIAQLKIVHSDGTEIVVATDSSWKSAIGPILKSDIYDGEIYDARQELNGWNMPNFNDANWKPVKKIDLDKDLLVASEGHPVRITETLRPIEIINTPKGELVIDMGQNLVGWVRFSLKGKPGEQIIIDHGEVLDQDGNFYNANLREAKARDVYIFKGGQEEQWHPLFTFHGFRYIRITDYSGTIRKSDIEAHVIHSDMEKIGHFTCSDPNINRLHNNIDWGLRGNFIDIPIDCPQRDERLGWTGDAQIFASTASFIRNTAPFYTKWLKDLTLEQKSDGSVPWVVPNVVKDGGGTGWSDGFGASGWSDAAIIIPWEVYQAYGDTRILENQYQSMRSWVEYMIGHAGDRYIFDYGFHFGDWLAFAEYMSYKYNAPDYGYAGAYTEKELVATAYFYYSTTLVKKIASILGKENDAERYASILPKIKKAFQNEFITETGRITSNSQTAYTLALSFGLYDEAMVPNAARRLATDVEHFEHLTTGFLGTPLISRTLSDHDYADLAYQLLFNQRYPSWLYPITKGATTIWERWDGIKPDGSFQTAGMNSFNHYAFGAIGNWLYTQVAGIQIDPACPGYKHIIIRPLVTNRLGYVEAWHDSLYGRISARWELTGGLLKLKIEIPVNTTATIYIPCNNEHNTDLSKISSECHNFTEIGMEEGYLKIETGSGIYEFNTIHSE